MQDNIGCGISYSEFIAGRNITNLSPAWRVSSRIVVFLCVLTTWEHAMPDTFSIRPYAEADERPVVRLWETVFANDPPWNVPADDIRRKLTVQRGLFLVGELEGHIIATVMAGFEGRRGWINRLAVLPEYRRQGFARALMAEAERRLEPLGCPKINLQVRASNREVVAFYESIGYEVEDLVSMGRRLTATETTSELPLPFACRISADDAFSLSEIRPSDKPALVEHLNDREIYEGTLRIPFPYTDADADQFLAAVAAETQIHGHPVQLAIRNAQQQLIGCLGFERLTYGHRAEIGYWLARDYRGRGIMTAAIEAACAFAAQEWRLVRITAQVFDFNRRSARLLEKCGFQLEGTQRKVHKKDGRFIDSRLYARVA